MQDCVWTIGQHLCNCLRPRYVIPAQKLGCRLKMQCFNFSGLRFAGTRLAPKTVKDVARSGCCEQRPTSSVIQTLHFVTSSREHIILRAVGSCSDRNRITALAGSLTAPRCLDKNLSVEGQVIQRLLGYIKH